MSLIIIYTILYINIYTKITYNLAAPARYAYCHGNSLQSLIKAVTQCLSFLPFKHSPGVGGKRGTSIVAHTLCQSRKKFEAAQTTSLCASQKT